MMLPQPFQFRPQLLDQFNDAQRVLAHQVLAEPRPGGAVAGLGVRQRLGDDLPPLLEGDAADQGPEVLLLDGPGRPAGAAGAAGLEAGLIGASGHCRFGAQ
jgi:hypothetical protein